MATDIAILSPRATGRIPRLANKPAQLIVGLAVLIALTMGIYYPALHSKLVADDFCLVGQVTFPDALAYFGKTFGFGRNEYRPLTALSYAVDRALWENNPEGYHLTNLLLHAAAAGLLFLFLQALTSDFSLALIAAFLFVIHPINTPRAIWISARDGSICAMFLLGALWLYVLSRKQNRTNLHVVAVGSAVCALLAYEGAVILPALMLLLEFSFFAHGSWRARTASSFRRTTSFWIIAAAYLCFWKIIFPGGVAGYDLSLTPLAILHNYARLLAALFYGGKDWALALSYVLLLVFSYRMTTGLRRVAAFGILTILIAFIPYCFTNGFAYRFGYISALGISLLLAACILAGFRSTGGPRQITLACFGILLCVYYVLADRKILLDWTEASEIAAQIPQAVRRLHPNLPAGAVLVFNGIPRSHGKAYVFPTGLDAAMQHEYPVRILCGNTICQ
jgi:hypothetical protein